ncbi:MAG: bifunctional DNA-formamidopyrimidine glycosylase/DNA-(apurinic or apyrimidinic site) lyase [bacterium]
MPELPEVETVRRGLSPFMNGARIIRVEQRRENLRFAFPDNFTTRLQGWCIESLERRAKYILGHLTSGETLIMHLGMSGRFLIQEEHNFARIEAPCNPAHDHVVFHIEGPNGNVTITYNDPRRFGFMDLVDTIALKNCRHFADMGPEPLGNYFSPESFGQAVKGRQTTIKQALLDQKIVAGIGNIYACEALFRAGISPKRKAASVSGKRAGRLVPEIRSVLNDAIQAGGSTLRDHARPDGELGYFQHNFQVYDREGAPCPKCHKPIRRLKQSGRSTFYCSFCQR